MGGTSQAEPSARDGQHVEVARLLAQLRRAVSARSAEEIRCAAAALRSSAHRAGAPDLARCGEALEALGRRKDFSWAEAWVVRGEELLEEPTRATWPGWPPPD